jgi:hypothetical protein
MAAAKNVFFHPLLSPLLPADFGESIIGSIYLFSAVCVRI